MKYSILVACKKLEEFSFFLEEVFVNFIYLRIIGGTSETQSSVRLNAMTTVLPDSFLTNAALESWGCTWEDPNLQSWGVVSI